MEKIAGTLPSLRISQGMLNTADSWQICDSEKMRPIPGNDWLYFLEKNTLKKGEKLPTKKLQKISTIRRRRINGRLCNCLRKLFVYKLGAPAMGAPAGFSFNLNNRIELERTKVEEAYSQYFFSKKSGGAGVPNHDHQYRESPAKSPAM